MLQIKDTRLLVSTYTAMKSGLKASIYRGWQAMSRVEISLNLYRDEKRTERIKSRANLKAMIRLNLYRDEKRTESKLNR